MLHIFGVIILILGAILYKQLKDHQDFFKKQNLPYLKSLPLLGSFFTVFSGKRVFFQRIYEIYNRPEFKDEPIVGVFLFHKPTIFVREPELVKKILITDFNSFNNHYSGSDSHDPLGHYQLSFAKNPFWKNLRGKMTPFFSSGRLKSSFYLIENLATDFNQYIHDRLTDGKVELELNKITDLYYIDVIASIAFGVEVNCLKNAKGEFQKAALSTFHYSFKRGFEALSMFMFPQIMKFFGFTALSRYTTDFIYRVMPEVIAERQKNKIKRNDLIDMLLEIKDDLAPENSSHSTEDVMLAQMGIFLTAGFKTSSVTTALTLYELSKHPELQERVRIEIRDALKRHGGRATFEMISSKSEMKLLHASINETLRIYPPLPFLDRVCTKPEGYSLKPYSDYTIPYGMPILVPNFALARDEKYFPDPLKYDPERTDNDENIAAYCLLPFGAGPRNCIGERLALIEIKTALVRLLTDFRVVFSEKSERDIELVGKRDKTKRGLHVHFIKDPMK